MKICMIVIRIKVMYRFPQTMSLKASELRNKVKVLSDDMSKVSGYFNELLDEFGESKDEYTADTFFEVLVKFYDAFMSELATLEKKKAQAEELKRKRKAQEELNKLKDRSAMDDFHKDTKGLNSTQVFKKAKKSAVFESRIRQSMNPSYNSPPPLESHTRPLQSSFFSPRETLGIENRFSAINNCRESMLSNVSEDYGMDLQEISSSDDDLETEKSRRDRMFRM